MSIGSYLESILSLEDKNIMMTGGTGGIGESVALGLARSGAKMIICDIVPRRLERLKEEIQSKGGEACTYLLDITDTKQVDQVVSEIIRDHERIDVLFNVAGINKHEGMLDVEETVYDKLMSVNLKGLYFVSQRVGKEMYRRRSGNIINIASHTSSAAIGGVSVYGAASSAVKSLTRSMAVEWAQYGIRCNAIAPGHIRTELTEPIWQHPEHSKYLIERIAMKRPGYPSELVGMAILLASDASSYMSGQTYHIDGGCLAGGAPWHYDTKY